MAITNFQLSDKTKRPPCCDFCCCGNKFGRIERSKYCKVHHGINRIKRSRRYVKHVERQLIEREIQAQLKDDRDYWEDEMRELKEFFRSEEDYILEGDYLSMLDEQRHHEYDFDYWENY